MQRFVYSEICKYRLGLRRNKHVLTKCNSCLPAIQWFYTQHCPSFHPLSKLDVYLSVSRVSKIFTSGPWLYFFDLDIYFRLFITKNAENSACQEDQVSAIFDFVTIGLVVVLCLTSRTFCPNPHHTKGYFGPWTFRQKSTQTQFLDISCSISGHFRPALVCSNQILGNFWSVYGGLHINIETIVNWAGAQNPTNNKDLDQPVHPRSLIRVFLFTGASLGFMATNWVLREGSDQSVWLCRGHSVW